MANSPAAGVSYHRGRTLQRLAVAANACTIIMIGLVGFAAERLVFGSLERAAIYRWGMARMAKG